MIDLDTAEVNTSIQAWLTPREFQQTTSVGEKKRKLMNLWKSNLD
jgi:hypothetical protein